MTIFQDDQEGSACVKPVQFLTVGNHPQVPAPLLRVTTCGLLTLEMVEEVVSVDPPLARYASFTSEQLRGRGTAPALTLLKLLVSRPERFALKDWLIDAFCHEREIFSDVRLDNIVSQLRSLLCPPAYAELRTHLVTHVRGSSSSGNGYQLAAYPLIWVDHEAIASNVEQAVRIERFVDDPLPYWESAYALAKRGSYLPDEIYSSWSTTRREEIAGLLRQSVQALAQLYLVRHGTSEEEEALLLLRSYWLDHLFEEDVLRSLMELLGQRERYHEALECYKHLQKLLEQESHQPDTQTQDVAAYLQNKQIHRERVIASLPPVHKRLKRTSSPLNGSGSATLSHPTFSFPFHPQEQILPFALSQEDIVQTIPAWGGVYEHHALLRDEWYHEGLAALQLPLQNMLGAFDAIAAHMSHDHYITSRRQMLLALAACPFAVLSWEQLRFGTSQNELFLTQCATSLVACHHLIKSQDFWQVKRILTHLVPILSQICQHVSTYQTIAAHLAAQSYLLLGILESHQLNWSGYRSFNESALQMSLLTTDTSLQIVASVQLAMAFFHFGQPAKALSLYQGAAHLVPASSPLVQSNFFVKQALAHAQAGQVADMHNCLEQSHRSFPQKPENDPSAILTDFGLSSLISWEATAQLQLVQRQREKPTKVWAILSQADQLPQQSSAKVLVYLQTLRAETALVSRDMELFVRSLSAGIQGARQLQSARRLQEAMDYYRMAYQQWPNEPRLQEMAECFIEPQKT